MEGVYYEVTDYAGIVRRLVIMLIDSIFLFVVFAIVYSFAPLFGIPDRNIILAFMVFTYIYLVIMKRSKIRTIAYRIVDTRIVDLKGNRPSIWKMTLRYLLLIGGPFNVLMDIFWLGGERDKQSIRDKFVGTYVIRNKANPKGKGEIITRMTDLFGLSLYISEVKRQVI